jgi:hydrogenase-4 component F
VTGIGRTQRGLGATMGVSLGTLAGLPPTPLFFSEVLILAGGFEGGWSWAAGIAAVLLALGFIGLIHSLIETTTGKAHRRGTGAVPGLRGIAILTALSVALLAVLAGAAFWLPGSSVAQALVNGIS